MKRFIAFSIAMILLFSVSLAEDIDLSGLSYEQLLELKARVNMAIWNSKEWQEVRVPMGIWQVGKSIPAGKWTVKCAEETYAFVKYGDTLKPGGTEVDYHGKKYGTGTINHPNYAFYEKGKDMVEFTFTVEDGDYVYIEHCDLIFTPYAGDPDFGFQ